MIERAHPPVGNHWVHTRTCRASHLEEDTYSGIPGGSIIEHGEIVDTTEEGKRCQQLCKSLPPVIFGEYHTLYD